MKKKDKINICIIVSLLFIFFILGLLVSLGLTKGIDNIVYNFIISFRCNFLDNYSKIITKLGNASYVIILLGLCVVLLRNRYALELCFCSSLSVVVNSIIKEIFRRDRPNILRLISQGGYSFPSGHSMITVCFYGFLFYYVFNKIKNKYLKIILLCLLSIIMVSIPISRIYVGVHYFTDVFGGIILGSCILFSIIKYGNKIIRGK